MIRVASSFKIDKALRACLFASTFTLDVQRNGVAAVFGVQISKICSAGAYIKNCIIVVARDFCPAWRQNFKFNPLKAKMVVVSDLDCQFPGAVGISVRRNGYVNFRLHVRFYSSLLTAIKSIVHDGYYQTDQGNHVRKLVFPKVLQCNRKLWHSPLCHSHDSPVVCRPHEAMCCGGWQARRFAPQRRACRFFSTLPSLVPP